MSNWDWCSFLGYWILRYLSSTYPMEEKKTFRSYMMSDGDGIYWPLEYLKFQNFGLFQLCRVKILFNLVSLWCVHSSHHTSCGAHVCALTISKMWSVGLCSFSLVKILIGHISVIKFLLFQVRRLNVSRILANN